MSLFYNRDRNITGVETPSGFSFNPSYGSSAVFSARNNYFGFTDKIANVSPLGLNHIIGEFSLNLTLRKDEAQEFVNFYESQSGTGILAITDNSQIYKTLSGTITSINNMESANNGLYRLGFNFNVERNSSTLNWSGQSFVNQSFVKWNTGVNYKAYDIVFFENDIEEPILNFFYCNEDHTSDFGNHPLSTGRKWTQNLFEDSNEKFSFQQTPLVATNDFTNSFVQRINDQKNIHAFDQFEVSYKNISDKKAKALLHFVESHLGFKRFVYQIPQIYNREKLFFAPNWTHQWNYKNSNDVKITMLEDPLGIIPSGNPALSVTQDSGNSNFNMFFGGENLFFDTGNGKELLTGSQKTFTWSSGEKHTVKIWGRPTYFTATGENLTKFQVYSAPSLTGLSINNNSIDVLNLYGAPNLRSLNAYENRILGFDLNGKPNLTYVNIAVNSGTYLNIGGSTGITGIYAYTNNFSTPYIDGALSGLDASNVRSGYADFLNNSGASSNVNAVSLSGKGWLVGFNHYPIASTTPALPTTTTTLEPSANTIFVQYSESVYDACHNPSLFSLDANGSNLGNSTVVNFASQGVVESGASVFYLSDGTSYSRYSKVCCDIAQLMATGVCPVSTTTTSTTTEEPTTTTTTTTTTTDPPMTTPPP
jgi:phage-related protein